MKNPLVYFVGAAVVAIGVVAAATYERWQDWPAALQTTGTPEVVDEYSVMTPEPETETEAPAPRAEAVEEVPPDEALPGDEAEVVVEEPAPEPEEQVEAAPEVVTSEPVEEMAEAPVEEEAPEPERLAAVDPQEPEAAAPDEPTVPEPEPDVAANPSFDVVRLEDDGSLIAVGRAAPDAMIELLLDGEVIATTSANEAGEWLIMPDNPLPSGSHELTVEASDRSGSGTASQVIALAVPERPGERPVLSEPAQPPEAEPEEEVAAAPEPALEEEPAPVESAEAPASDTPEQDVALAPLPEPEVEPDAPATRQAEPPAAEEQPEEQAAVAPEPPMEPEREVEQVTEPLDVPLALETVDYNDKGEIVFSGRADSGRTVRIYVDGRLVGEATADGAGQWAFAGGEDIAPGRHTLRADLTDATGEVYGRILLPFVRAETLEVAALVESRRNAGEERETAEVVPEEVAPEPEPEAPMVAEEAVPEPEPDAPMVAEEAVPEPEPEAPMVAEEAVPEPEPEAPLVAEEAVPEPKPEAPMMAEEVAPEPQPEIPVMAEEVAPEPEPEAPVVAEEPEPEPEPEAPVIVEEVAPEPAREAPVVVAETAPQSAPQPAGAPQAAPEATRLEPVRPEERLRVAGIDEPGGRAAGEVVAAGPGHVVIQPGNNLWRISRVIYGRGIEYTVIYQANRDQIRDPDLIYPGQIFITPGVNPPKEIDPEWREPLNAEARQDAAE